MLLSALISFVLGGHVFAANKTLSFTVLKISDI